MLELQYKYVPTTSSTPLHCLSAEDAEARVKALYSHLWLNAEDRAEGEFSIETLHTGSFTVTAEDIEGFNAAIPAAGAYWGATGRQLQAPPVLAFGFENRSLAWSRSSS